MVYRGLFYTKCLLVFFTLFINRYTVYGQSERDSLLNELDKSIENDRLYDAEKLTRIENIERTFKPADDLTVRYGIYQQLYEEFKIFTFDSAFIYAKKLEEIAFLLHDPSRINASRLKLSFVLLSAGMFKETFDAMHEINIKGQPDSLQAEYYSLMGRYYYDLADYNNDKFHSPAYISTGNEYLDSASLLFSANSFEHLYFTGLSSLKKGKMEKAYADFQALLNKPDLTEHQWALITSTLSYIYKMDGKVNKAINYQIRAAIADIKSSTKETFATFSLAQLLFDKGDFERASAYIEKAIADASYYGARQRKVQVSSILQIIQNAKISNVEKQRRSLIIYGAIATFFLVVLIFLLGVIYRQFVKLGNAKRMISEAHANLREANTRLQEVNTRLHSVNGELNELNHKLSEANKIKEEYIGYFFNINSGFFLKVERFKRSIEQKIAEHKTDEIKAIVNNINIKNEKEDLLKSFDKVFLKLFPNFVEEFNALFNEEDQIQLKDDELLNTELRIYALMRMGITDNEKIAQILEYSVKTIYAYKTKVRNRTKVPKEELDKRVMSIKSL